MNTPSRWREVAGQDAGAAYAARFAALAATGADVHGEARLCASLVPAGARVLDAGCGTGRVSARLAELGYVCVGVDADPSMLDQARALSSRVRWVLADLATIEDATGLLGDPKSEDALIDPVDRIDSVEPGKPGNAVSPAGSASDQDDELSPLLGDHPVAGVGTVRRQGWPAASDTGAGGTDPPGGSPRSPARFDLVVLAGNVVPLLGEGTHARVVRMLGRALRLGGLMVAGFGLDPAHLPLDFAPVDLESYDAWCAAAGLERRYRFASWDGDPYDGGGYAVSVHRRVVREPDSRREPAHP